MKILIVTASPKKRLSTSMYFSLILKLYLLGHKVDIIDLKSVREYNKVIEKLDDIDAFVWAFPTYVDAVPSTVLEYMIKLENYTKDKNYDFLVYTINNCGFYEGNQCEYTLNMTKNWCKRANLKYAGGIGIGAGEMYNVLRLNIPVGILVTILQLMSKGSNLVRAGQFSFENLFNGYMPTTLIICILVTVIFSLGAFVKLFMVRNNIIHKKISKDIFTTVWFCPKFLFVWLGSIYWVLRAFLIHGVFIKQLFQKDTIKQKNKKRA